MNWYGWIGVWWITVVMHKLFLTTKAEDAVTLGTGTTIAFALIYYAVR